VVDTPMQVSSQEEEENSEHKKLKKDGNFCISFILVSKHVKF
jgi:hypothetical protein